MTVTQTELPTLNEGMLGDLYAWIEASDKSWQDWFDQHPEFASWKQGTWAEVVRNGTCKSAFCMAGQASALLGYIPVVTYDKAVASQDQALDPHKDREQWVWRSGYGENGDEFRASGAAMVKPEDVAALGGALGPKDAYAVLEARQMYPDGNMHPSVREPWVIAQEALGLTDHESDNLFSGGNTVEDIKRFINTFAVQRGIDFRVGDGEVANPTITRYIYGS